MECKWIERRAWSKKSLIYSETLPQLLKKTGYKTIHAGKALFGSMCTSGENPIYLGFDVNIAGHAAGVPRSYLVKNNFSRSWYETRIRITDRKAIKELVGEFDALFHNENLMERDITAWKENCMRIQDIDR